MLRCKDNSIYTGIASNLERRMEEHFSQDKKCAKYTKTHHAQKLEAAWESENKVLASKLEYRIKTLSKKDKEKLIENNSLLEILFKEKIEADKYTSLKNEILLSK